MRVNPTETPFRLKITGPLTFERRVSLESTVVDAMRRYEALEADLSEVSEIDLYGVHLLGLLQSVGTVVAISPSVEEASRRLLSSCRGVALGRLARRSASAH
jgi:ABC-type transporter Mla MlaB component